jgi:hypothetical protein
MDVEAVRAVDAQLTLLPGSMAFLVNNADAYEEREGKFFWTPLSVVYCDRNDRKGEVFRFTGCLDGGDGQLVEAELVGVVRLVRENQGVVWRNPLNGRLLLRFPGQDADKLLRNGWYIFRGAILPLLYHESYCFVETPEDQTRLQAQLMRQIHATYQGLVS